MSPNAFEDIGDLDDHGWELFLRKASDRNGIFNLLPGFSPTEETGLREPFGKRLLEARKAIILSPTNFYRRG